MYLSKKIRSDDPNNLSLSNISVKLELDGREVELPELESIVVLNINRYVSKMAINWEKNRKTFFDFLSFA